MAAKVLTIVIGNEQIKLAEVTYTAQKIVQVHKAVTIDTPDNCVNDGNLNLKSTNALLSTLSSAIKENRISSRSVIFSIQSSKIISKEAVAPALKDAKLEQYINANASEYFPIKVEDYVLTYSVLDSYTEDGKKKLKLMVAAAPSTMVDAYYSLADSLNLTVLRVDYVGNSMLQLIKAQVEAEPTLVVQLGEDSTMVSVFVNNVLQLTRTVPYGKSTVSNTLMDVQKLTYEEACDKMATSIVLANSFSYNDEVTESLRYLVNNISRVMDYYGTKNSTAPITKGCVIVEGSTVKGIENLLRNELNIPVELVESLKQVVSDPQLSLPVTEISNYTSNIGSVIDPVNFVSRHITQKAKKESSAKYYRLAVLVAILIAVILVAYPLVQYFTKDVEKKNLQKNIDEIAYVQDIVDEYYIAFDKYTDARNFEALTLNPNDDIMELVEYLENEMPSDISITSLSANSGVVNIACTGSSKTTMAKFIMVLKANPNISDVNAASVSETINAIGTVTDTYSITFNYGLEDKTAAGDTSSDTSSTQDEEV